MRCRHPLSFHPGIIANIPDGENSEKSRLPDVLTDCLTGHEIPFSNKDNIRQKTLKVLLDEKGYSKEDFAIDMEIKFHVETRQVTSTVDISIVLGGITSMVWKCASGSLVSRERQILSAARLLEGYIVPFAAVTNGLDIEFLDAVTGNIIGCGISSIPSKEELLKNLRVLTLKPVNKKKLAIEQRILFTYDSISCPAACDGSANRGGSIC